MSTTTPKSKAAAHSEPQRDRILCAAHRCFVESGFHAASMASIAKTAEISAGLIYRYFDSKNAIILAIIAHHLAEIQAEISGLQATAEVVIERIMARFRSWHQRECVTLEPGLLLEIVALARRDPQVAEALRTADHHIRADLSAWLTRAWEKAGYRLSEADVSERVFAFQGFIEGLAIRAIKQPDIDPQSLNNSLRPLLAYLLPDSHIIQQKNCHVSSA